MKEQASEAALSSIQQTVGCAPHASCNVISASKIPHLPAYSREDFFTFHPQQINFSRNNIFTGAANQTEAIYFQSTTAAANFQGNVGAILSEFSCYDYNFQQHNETGAQLTSCRFSKQTLNDQYLFSVHHGNQQYDMQDGSISSSAFVCVVDNEDTVLCTTGVIHELAHGTADYTSQGMHPTKAHCASTFFHNSDGSSAWSTTPVYNNGMVIEQNHLQYTREGVAHERQPLVTPHQSGQSFYHDAHGFPDVANPMC